MKQPLLLPTIFVVIILGFVHVQFKGRSGELPVKELVAVGVVLIGAAYVLKASKVREQAVEDTVEKKAQANDDLDMAA